MRKSLFLLIISMVMIVVSCGTKTRPTNDWPMSEKGPDCNRVFQENKEEKPVLTDILTWKYNFEAEIYTMPAISENRAFIGTNDGKLYCLDAITGESIWKSTIKAENFGFPAVDNDKVCVVFEPSDDLLTNDMFGQMVCLDVKTGEQVWSFKDPKSIITEATISDGSVFFATEDHVYSLNIQTGKKNWEYAIALNIIRDMSRICIGMGGVCFGSDKMLVCLDEYSGKLLWEEKYEEIVLTPTYCNGKFYFGSLPCGLDWGNPKTFKSNAYIVDAKSGKTEWTVVIDYPPADCPVVLGNIVCFAGVFGDTQCIDIDKKKKLWESTGYFKPIFIDGKLFVQLDNNEICQVDVTTGKLVKSTGILRHCAYSNGRFYFTDKNSVICKMKDSPIKSSWLDVFSAINPRQIKKDGKSHVCSDNSKVFLFSQDKVIWQTPDSWEIVQADYPWKKNAYFWENKEKIVVFHEQTYSCLDRKTGKELWSFKPGTARLTTIDGYIMNFVEDGIKEIAFNITDGTSKVTQLELGNDVVLYEADCSESNFKEKKLSMIKTGIYLITTNSGGVHGPHSFYYYVFNLKGKTCTVKSPGERGNTEYSKLQNLKEKYYFTFNYEEFMGGDNYKEFTKAFEADVSTGITKEIKLNEIPGNALDVQPAYMGDDQNYQTSTSEPKIVEVKEDEIAKKTGITAQPGVKYFEGGSSTSNVYGWISGDYIIVTRYNCSTGSDLTNCSYDLFAVFEKKTWKKIWETGGCESYRVIGSLIFVEHGNILNIATGKNATPYSNIKLIDQMNDMLFMFASRDNKPKIVVLNLKKIDELKNLEPPKQQDQQD